MKIEILGSEVRYKTVKRQGTAGGIYLPAEWIGRNVAVVLDADKPDKIESISPKGRICYSYYVLDLVHKGHIIHMERAKAAAGPNGISIAGILTDEAVMEKKTRPILDFDARMDLARSIRYNDFVVSQDTYSPLPNLYRIKPDIVLESDSHNPDDIHKVEEYMKEIKGRVIVTPYYPGISSTGLKQKVKGEK